MVWSDLIGFHYASGATRLRIFFLTVTITLCKSVFPIAFHYFSCSYFAPMAAWVAVLNCGLKENLLDIHIFRNTGNTGVPKDAFTKVLKTQLINNSWRRKKLLTELVTKGALFSYLPFKNWTGISMDWNNNGLKQWFVRLDNFFLLLFYIIFICVFVWLCNLCEHMHGGC